MHAFTLLVPAVSLALLGSGWNVGNGGTGSAQESSESAADDGALDELPRLRVFVPELDATVELRGLVEKLATVRADSDLLLVRRIARGLPPERTPVLIPYLVHLLDGSDDPVDRFATGQISIITGLSLMAQKAAIRAWHRRWESILSIESSSGPEGIATASRVLADVQATETLQLEAIGALARLATVESAPVLLAAMQSRRVKVRIAASDTLREITGVDHLRYRARGSEEEIVADLIEWRDHWQTNQNRIRYRAEWPRLRKRLLSTRDPAQRRVLRARIAALGAPVLPDIERILLDDDYAFDWVMIRELITARRAGLR